VTFILEQRLVLDGHWLPCYAPPQLRMTVHTVDGSLSRSTSHTAESGTARWFASHAGTTQPSYRFFCLACSLALCEWVGFYPTVALQLLHPPKYEFASEKPPREGASPAGFLQHHECRTPQPRLPLPAPYGEHRIDCW
jgi:hypothetical protein